MNGVLISEPIAALDCIISVPSPVISVHVSKRSIYATLSSNGMRPRREKFGNASGFEALLDQTKGGSKSSSSGPHNNSIEGMIDNRIFLEQSILNTKRVTSASLDRCWLPMTLKLYLGAETILKVLPVSSLIIPMILCSQEQKILG